MVLICRAEDGEVFQVSAGLSDIERQGNLEQFLYQETGVEPEAILAFLSDGRRLTTENVRELAGARDETIYVFNKDFLELDRDDVLEKLRIYAPLQPPIDDANTATPPVRPSQVATSYLSAAHFHLRDVKRIMHSITYQQAALTLSLSSLDKRVLQISDTFEEFGIGATRELEKQATLLQGLDADLEIVSRVRIHPEFMSAAVQRAIKAGEKGRTLGDYVSNVKMRQVAETCSRTHTDLESRYNQIREAMQRLTDGTNALRDVINDPKLLNDSQSCANRCQDTYERMTDAAGTLESPAADPSRLVSELRQLDASLRNDVNFMTDAKNAYTERIIDSLRQIAMLNDDVVRIPIALTSLQASFKVKNSFSHIQRLHNMFYAYGATVVEIVRRKEFSRFFLQRAQSILEIMAKLTTAERKRRQVYRGEIHGQLPFETRGMEDPVPSIDFSPSGAVESAYSLERSDIDELLRLLDDLEHITRATDPHAHEALLQTRMAIDKSVARIDNLESSFDRIAERSLLSASRLTSSRRRTFDADEKAFEELSSQLHEVQQSKADQEGKYRQEIDVLRAELSRMKTHSREMEGTLSDERARADKLESELQHTRAQIESDTMTRHILEDRNKELVFDLERQQHSLSVALAEATEKTKAAEVARQQLAQVCAEFEDVKALESANAAKIGSLLRDQAITLRNLEDARSRGEDLHSQIDGARNESERMNRALEDAAKEKDRLLRAQASEHDRIMRDHIAEADGDRAVLEHQFSEMKATLEERERQLRDLRAECDLARADGSSFRDEQHRIERELRDARTAERILREDLKAGRASQSSFEQRLEQSGRLVAQILDVALAFRHSHVKALSMAQAMSTHPGGVGKTPPNLNDSVFSTGLSFPSVRRGFTTVDEPSPIDPSDPALALEALRAYDQDSFLEAISKTGSTIRKWQKQCKDYRERAKGKISFRNFAKGDLALFLPTRNSVSKPWAAFNVSFPHYFLQATGHLAEQLKTREWIVARITSITERIVDHKNPSSNPYGLGDGIKYYMLEVEDWTQPAPTKRRVSSRKASSGERDALPTLTPSTVPLPPGPPEAEDEESFGTTRPPTSHLFPVRARTPGGSSPPARPSALSKLLAQAGPGESPVEPIPPTPRSQSSSPAPISSSPAQVPARKPSPEPSFRDVTDHAVPAPKKDSGPATGDTHGLPERHQGNELLPPLDEVDSVAPLRSPPTPSSSRIAANGTNGVAGSGSTGLLTSTQPMSMASPLRPGSRASRLSFSARPTPRPAFPVTPSGVTTAKASPTTAITELPSIGDPFIESPPLESAGFTSPSPEGSISEDMSKVLNARRRTASSHILPTSPLATNSTTVTGAPAAAAARASATSTLANLASSWGVAFGRRRKTEMALPSPAMLSTSPGTARTMSPEQDTGNVPGAFVSSGVASDRRGSVRARTPSTASEILKRF